MCAESSTWNCPKPLINFLGTSHLSGLLRLPSVFHMCAAAYMIEGLML